MKEYMISFLISYIVGNIPTVKEKILGNKTLKDHLEDCFKKAVERWDVPNESKKSISDDMDRYILHLKDFITQKNKGRHPKENELLALWSEEIIKNKECNQYISSLQNEEILKITGDIKSTVTAIIKDINSSTNNINAKLDSIFSAVTRFCNESVNSLSQPHIELSDFDLERLKEWTSVDNPAFFQSHSEDGSCTYRLGVGNKYHSVKGKEKLEWDDFFDRMQQYGFIGIEKYDKSGNPFYRLKKAAYDYISRQKENTPDKIFGEEDR